MMPGHSDLKCEDCHRASTGTTRQQMQALVHYWLGFRDHAQTLGHRPVSTKECLDCHERKKDTHPVFRFYEPRFEKARQNLQPHICVNCHREHRGARVSVKPDMCSTCHEKVSLKKEKIDVPHRKLAQEKRWGSCLGCHDFHGNHRMKLPTKMSERIAVKEIESYFYQGSSPYGTNKIYSAKKELKRDEHH